MEQQLAIFSVKGQIANVAQLCRPCGYLSQLLSYRCEVKAAIDAEAKKGIYALILTSNNALYGTEDISDSIIKTLNAGK